MKYYIYRHTNIHNDKSYIGWTNKTPEKRWKNHCLAANKNIKTLFAQAIRKYGINDWSHEVLDVVLTLKGAKKAEKLWIAHYQTNFFKSGCGYNMTDGGDGWTGHIRIITQQHCDAISRAKILQYRDPHERKKLSLALLKGKSTQKAYENACNAQTKRYSDPVNRLKMRETNTQKRKVCQLSKDWVFIRTFDSISEAIQETKVGNVKLCCRKKRNFAGGYRWEYYESYILRTNLLNSGSL